MDTGAIVTVVIGVIISIIGFFLKRTISQVDQLDQSKASKEELDAVKKDVSAQYKSISEIKENYLTKDDFFREQAKTEGKLDRIMDILLEIKGGGKHG